MKLFIISAIAATVWAECSASKVDEITNNYNTCIGGGTEISALCKCTKTALKKWKAAGCGTDTVAYETSKKYVKENCGGCFPATSTVELESGKAINLDQLQIGEKVRVGPSEFSEVFFFSTEMADTNSKFVKLITDSSAVTMTANHYLYVNGVLTIASDVQVGDSVVLANGTTAAVNEVSSVWAPGLYNPHTLHGDIVVDGIHTSTYTDVVHPTLAHALLSPLRTMYSAGISFGKDFRDTAKSMPSWLRQAMH